MSIIIAKRTGHDWEQLAQIEVRANNPSECASMHSANNVLGVLDLSSTSNYQGCSGFSLNPDDNFPHDFWIGEPRNCTIGMSVDTSPWYGYFSPWFLTRFVCSKKAWFMRVCWKHHIFVNGHENISFGSKDLRFALHNIFQGGSRELSWGLVGGSPSSGWIFIRPPTTDAAWDSVWFLLPISLGDGRRA